LEWGLGELFGREMPLFPVSMGLENLLNAKCGCITPINENSQTLMKRKKSGILKSFNPR